MHEGTAYRIVKIFAVIAWASAIITIIAGAQLLIMGTIPEYSVAFGGLGTWSAGRITSFAGGVLLAAGLLYLALGAGLWGRTEWSRITLAALAAVSGVLSVASIIFGLVNGQQVYAPLVSLGIAALEVWLFQFQPDIRKQFVHEEPQAYPRVTIRAIAAKRNSGVPRRRGN